MVFAVWYHLYKRSRTRHLLAFIYFRAEKVMFIEVVSIDKDQRHVYCVRVWTLPMHQMWYIVLKAVLSLHVSNVTLLLKVNVFCRVLAHPTVCNLPETIYMLTIKSRNSIRLSDWTRRNSPHSGSGLISWNICIAHLHFIAWNPFKNGEMLTCGNSLLPSHLRWLEDKIFKGHVIFRVLVIDPRNLQATRRTITDKINCAPQRLSFWPVTKIMWIFF
jgi:hypothetical protein